MTKTYFKAIIKERNKFKNIIITNHSPLLSEAERCIGLATKINEEPTGAELRGI